MNHHITLIGLGTIGISMAALHLRNSTSTLHLFDTRPDLQAYIESTLPPFLSPDTPSVTSLLSTGRLIIHSSLESAIKPATIIQEQGPETPTFKQTLWKQVESLASKNAHFWTSTSGIPASVQMEGMSGKTRLLVVHPFNPPHIMPLIELVPAPTTTASEVDFAREYFSSLGSGHRPVVVKKEVPGFVGNRLAFALLREACHLVKEGVVSAPDLDTILMASLGPRWAVNGVFESYQAGGGEGGIGSFLGKLEGTIQHVWDDLGKIDMEGDNEWREEVVRQTDEAYGVSMGDKARVKEEKLRKVLDVQNENIE
ncbi:hypothetical protein ASPWEDRAFT_111901 [Aspergillus wentii DTO 134E9]|uniref:L-gulonate 3-dehydrogenase n=1 Tax=Aspergillus wentii DTO 134E9 TaxID=1073089 RepID=A0A1L9RM53_ASPWE|nr:uncharacterized protein ASPWEDRAFT_111901 [Aspergillus wentii DTO 134E9]KAI9929585.1 hypothetical protein MW887_001059 [Aspergillus wentii]OJJ35974.1 hypothetical protein ASPWEDRAFT_111901 [Aspergillus wentii DTO 134E9]